MSASSAARPAAQKETATANVKDRAQKHQYLVIEITSEHERRFPKALFGCATLEEALKLCKQMNADAGFQKFAVRGNKPPQAD